MKWTPRILGAIAASAALVFIILSGEVEAADLGSGDLAGLAAKVTPAVVSISTFGTSAAPRSDPRKTSAHQGETFTVFGSGFIVDASGYIVTNSHVLADAQEIQITLKDGGRFPAKVVGADDGTDLALLKIDAPRPLPYVSFGDSDLVEVGDRILAVGNPYGLGGTVTTGIVSATGRDLHNGAFDDFLQIDASINPGNSGGPSFNLKGEVVGVNSAIASPNGGSVGLGFAIPSDIARSVIQELRMYGRVARGWIGIRVQEVTADLAESLDLAQPQGALVTSIQPGGPAAVAGLRQGDVILAFDGQEVDEARVLPRIVAAEPAGRHVDLVVWRNGSRATMAINVAEVSQPPRQVVASQPHSPAAGGFLTGMQLVSLTGDLRRRLGLPKEVKGVAILGLADGSLAAGFGLQRGDIIEQVERHYVTTPAELDRRIQEAGVNGRSAILLLVRRGADELYLVVKPAESMELGDPFLYYLSKRFA